MNEYGFSHVLKLNRNIIHNIILISTLLYSMSFVLAQVVWSIQDGSDINPRDVVGKVYGKVCF